MNNYTGGSLDLDWQKNYLILEEEIFKLVFLSDYRGYKVFAFFCNFGNRMMMKAFKRTFGFIFSVVLLLSFSALILPLDFLHNHDLIPVSIESGETQSSNSQKVNVQNKADYCWVCAVHIDKNYTKTSFFENIRQTTLSSVLLNSEPSSNFFELVLSFLRGPPAV